MIAKHTQESKFTDCSAFQSQVTIFSLCLSWPWHIPIP